jgi:enoyl-CoA hydratase/carnithine racemase
MTGEEGERWGYFNRLVERAGLMETAVRMAAQIADGPNFANAMTKNQLNLEWDMSLDSAIEAEAQAQAICMQTKDFERAYRAFVDKRKPVFEGD